jgi:hypothetical protein
MAQTTHAATVAARRRAFFGLFDADGWAWAGVKAALWFVIIVTMIGYIPDRAYYFTVGQTVDLWPAAPFIQWSPVNFCTPLNETLPCPAPAGATLPWHPSRAEIQLPAGRADGVAAAVGTTYLYVGGSDGKAATASVFVSHPVGSGNLDKWSQGPDLPAPRADAAAVTIGSTLYVIGGLDASGAPASTVYSLAIANDGTIGAWKTVDKLALPAPRAGASAVAVSDGIVLLGGTDGKSPTRSVWKAQQDKTGAFTAWADQSPLYEESVDGVAVHVGDVIFLAGGRNASGKPVATVQQGFVGGGAATAANPNLISAYWRVSEQTNLPAPRAKPSGFTVNGGIYIQGGNDGTGQRPEAWWATPDASGIIPGWQHLDVTDLGQGIEGASAFTAGPYAFLVGGRTSSGLTGGAARAYLAPQLPFFRLGLLGVTIPGLTLGGEVGQQLGYLNAFTVGLLDFVVLLAVGWAFAHKEQVRGLVARRRRRG